MTTLRTARDAEPFTTLDGSTIREFMHPNDGLCAQQSLAEARVEVGGRTTLHRHHRTEELYHVLSGQGRMTLGDEHFDVGPGDTVAIPPGTAHCIENGGAEMLVFLCCCAPAYDDADTELLE
ncbi:MAG: cupin domain-containing protein [Pseudomonadales bacterium]|jgi:mannose-6-phosphate isomerase-like protein (cupin superfamily)|nr:cupin domain-containing protein [Pseudomonadales bacterium]